MAHDKQSGLRGPDQQQRDHIKRDAGFLQDPPEGLERERRGPLDKNVGRGNQRPPEHVPSPGQPAKGE